MEQISHTPEYQRCFVKSGTRSLGRNIDDIKNYLQLSYPYIYSLVEDFTKEDYFAFKAQLCFTLFSECDLSSRQISVLLGISKTESQRLIRIGRVLHQYPNIKRAANKGAMDLYVIEMWLGMKEGMRKDGVRRAIELGFLYQYSQCRFLLSPEMTLMVKHCNEIFREG